MEERPLSGEHNLHALGVLGSGEGLPFELMSEESGKDIGNSIGIYVETDKRSGQTDQAKFMRIRVELQIDKPLRRGGGTLRTWKMKGYG